MAYDDMFIFGELGAFGKYYEGIPSSNHASMS